MIDSPLSVSRVSPPTAIITQTSANSTISQTRIAPRAPERGLSITPGVAAARVSAGVVSTSSKMLRCFAMRPVPFPMLPRPGT